MKSVQHYPNHLDRTESLMRMVPELFTYDTLYIGARGDRADYLNDFKRVTVMEAYVPNCLHLEAQGYSVINWDVRDFKTLWQYECIFWWHGPEHIRKSEFRAVLRNLEEITTKVIVMGCPWGWYPQGEIYGNKYEKHLSHWGYSTFRSEGFKIETLGHFEERGSNITAVKYV